MFTAGLLYWNATRLPLTEAWWQLPIFHPTSDTLAFSEHLLGLSVIATPIYWMSRDPIVTQNVTTLLMFPLCGMAMFALVRRVTGSAAAAFLAGLAFAFAPYRAGQLPHVHVLAMFWTPLVFLGLHVFLETGRRRWLALYAGAWFLQVMSNAYMLVLLSTLVGLWVLWFVVAPRRWRDLRAIAAATALALVPLAPILRTYVSVHERHGFERTIGEMREFSAEIGSLLCAPQELTFWGWLRLYCRSEATLFPGVAISALAIAAMWLVLRTRDEGSAHAATRRRRLSAFARSALLLAAGVYGGVVATVLLFGPWAASIGPLSISATTIEKPLVVALAALVLWLPLTPGVRAALRQSSLLGFYVLAALLTWTLALGPTIIVGGRPLAVDGPFSLLMTLPGVDGLRVPARFWTMTLLCLSVGLGILAARVASLWRGRSAALAFAAVAAMLAVDGWMYIPVVPAPARAPAPHLLAGETVIEVPTGDVAGDIAAGYRAVAGGWKTVNGYSGYLPSYYAALHDTFRAEEDSGLRWFQQAGPLHVIVPREAPRQAALVARQPGAVLTGADDRALQYRLPARPRPGGAPPRGERMRIARLESGCSPERLAALVDGDESTRWRCDPPDRQRVSIDLGRVTQVGMLVHHLGPYDFEFPRRLDIETSADGHTWDEARSGSVLFEVIEGGFANPRSLALALPFEPRPARFVRVGHRSFEAGAGWTITELEVWSGGQRRADQPSSLFSSAAR